MIYCEDVHYYKNYQEEFNDSFNKISTAFFIDTPDGVLLEVTNNSGTM